MTYKSAHGRRNPCRCKPCLMERALLDPATAIELVEGYCDRLATQNPAPSELAAGIARRDALRALVGVR